MLKKKGNFPRTRWKIFLTRNHFGWLVVSVTSNDFSVMNIRSHWINKITWLRPFFPGGRGRGSSKTWISDVPNYSKKTITSTSDDGYVKILVKICNQWFFCFTWILTMILIILRKGINFLSKNEVLGLSSSKIICKGDIPSFHHISSIDTPCHPKAPQVPLASPDIGAEATHLTWKAHMICWRVVSSSGWRVVAGDQRKGRKKKTSLPPSSEKIKKER